MSPKTLLVLAVSLPSLAAAACGRNPEPASQPPPGYSSFADTTVCVVDRAAETGLRALAAKRDPEGRLLLSADGEVRPLESVHPVSLIAGYGGAEPWFSAGEAIPFRGDRFVKVESERSIPRDLLSRVGEHQGILLFADPGDEPPPEAIYVPVRPGCIFQAYVREDLMRGGA
jgi:hypothetical protein